MAHRTPPIGSLALLLALLTTAGCGSAEEPEPATDAPATSASPTPSPQEAEEEPAADAGGPYVTSRDTEPINAAALRTVEVGQKAGRPQQLRRCNAASEEGYPAWRECWHGLLDPYVSGLGAMSQELAALAEGDFAAACVQEAKVAAARFDDFADVLEDLLDGIDSPRRQQQVRAVETYSASLRHVGTDFPVPLQALTRACLSPEELEGLRESPSS